MIRFANPGSDISGFTRIFQALVEALEDRQPFSLDDISEALVSNGLATSSGFMGAEALRRSTRKDRSRDPLYNQSKMYSELFRLLGWIHPTEESRLDFRFTWLGQHVREAGTEAKMLVAECVLGIAFPNEVVKAKGEYKLRPFATILRAMDALDGMICRDEMIMGPLSLSDDTDSRGFDDMVARIRRTRGDVAKLEDALDGIAQECGIQRNTMMNYTRFPLAVLEWSGWTAKSRESGVYKRSAVFHHLTEEGQKQVEWVSSAADARAAEVLDHPEDVQVATCKLAVLRMLDRAGFETREFATELDAWAAELVRAGIIPEQSKDVLFSPFQEMPTAFADGLFGATGTSGAESHLSTDASRGASRSGRTGAPVMPVLLRSEGLWEDTVQHKAQGVADVLRETASGQRVRADDVVEEMMARYADAALAEFYPLVAGLFACLGFDCTASRVGVNYARWDAFIEHPSDSVPIEIKSPAEETSVSVKAVRQALENKIILMARRAFPTQPATTSLAVGYLLPNDRSEVGDLVADIYSAFGVNIGIIDLRSLLVLAVGVVLENKAPDTDAILNLRGFIDVINT